MSASSVYFQLNLPFHVVLLLRRIVNVVSTLSISNQCLSASSSTAPGMGMGTGMGMGVDVDVEPLVKTNNVVGAGGEDSGLGFASLVGLPLPSHIGGSSSSSASSSSASGSSNLPTQPGVVTPKHPHPHGNNRHVNISFPPDLNNNINIHPNVNVDLTRKMRRRKSGVDTREREGQGELAQVRRRTSQSQIGKGRERDNSSSRSTWMWLRTSHYLRWHWQRQYCQWDMSNRLLVPPASAMSISTHAHAHAHNGHGQMGPLQPLLSSDGSLSSVEPSFHSPSLSSSSSSSASPSPHTPPPPKLDPTRWIMWTWKRLSIFSSSSWSFKSNRHTHNHHHHHHQPDPEIQSPPPPPPHSPSSKTKQQSHPPRQDQEGSQNHNHNHNHNHPSASSNMSSSPHSHRQPHPDSETKVKEAKAQADDVPRDIIHQLLANPALFDPVRTPRYPIVLSHGLYGFDSRGPSAFPSMRMHYWSNVLNILRGTVGAEVIVTSVPGTGFISTRASALHDQLSIRARGRGINFLAHSMGGLDCRYLISRIRPSEYVPLSLTTIGTPHRGSPFMDWCATNIGLGKLRQQEQERERAREMQREREMQEKMDMELESEMMALLGRRSRKDIEDFTADIEACDRDRDRDARQSNDKHNEKEKEKENRAESKSSSSSSSSSSASSSSSSSSSPLSLSSLSSLPSSFTTLILSIVDSPAYANLTSSYLTEHFNPRTPDDPRVRYWSVAGRMDADSVGVWHPFWLPKMVLDGVEEKEREKMRRRWVGEREMESVGGVGFGLDSAQFGEGDWGGKVPLWADERQWGNDGLVTVQSAQWGEFLGIMEGCDHWEMRGARGIELGVDLPAIPAIGLGSFPLASSVRNKPPSSSGVQQQQQQPRQADGDGWGFGDWTRFVSAWKRSSSSGSSSSLSNSSPDQAELKDKENENRVEEDVRKMNPSPSSPLVDPEAGSSSAPTTTPAHENDNTTREAATEQELEKEKKGESKSEKRERERLADDQVVKTSTDTLSVVFDWLIERVPVSTQILGGGGGSGGGAGHTTSPPPSQKHVSDKELGDAAVRHMVGGGGGSASAGADSSESEMKKRMDKEDKGRNKKRELARKEDLERFYVALARKMYDEGL